MGKSKNDLSAKFRVAFMKEISVQLKESDFIEQDWVVELQLKSRLS